MGYDPSDSSGTDDDLPPSHQNRDARGRVTGNGRTVGNAIPYPTVQNAMEFQIHLLEQDAYTSVLRAFKAQSDAITWEKESLITELRKELRVSDKEHRELLSKVNADDIIRRIREWRQGGGIQSGLLGYAQPGNEQVCSTTVSASHRRKASQAMPSLSLGAPSPVLRSQSAVGMQPSSLAAKKSSAVSSKGKKHKSYPSTGPSGRVLAPNRSSSGTLGPTEPAEALPYDNLIGRKVMTRWPEDNNFYGAVITDYKPIEGVHLLVYDINTNSETWEWVNLKEISPEDIRWEGEDLGMCHNVGRGGSGCEAKKLAGRGCSVPSVGRGRGSFKSQNKKDFPLLQNGIGKKGSGGIEILHTDTLIKEVERVFNASHLDPLEIEKAKEVLKEHEQSLIDAIARLANASDSESDDGEQQFSHGGQPMDQDQGWRNRHFFRNYDGNMLGEVQEAYGGGHLVGEEDCL